MIPVPDATIVRSEFDSAVFGVPFYRVTATDPAALPAAFQGLPAGPLIVDAKVAADAVDMIGALDSLGFRKASTLVEFAAAPSGDAGQDDDVARMLDLSEADLDEHARGFRFQRFRQDPRLPRERSMALMRQWIANSLGGRREVLALGRNFCTFAVDGGRLTIDLLSCPEAGRGMAGRLMRAVHAEAAARGCGEVRVTTEAENTVAMRVYLRAGFLPVSSWAAMHLVRT